MSRADLEPERSRVAWLRAWLDRALPDPGAPRAAWGVVLLLSLQALSIAAFVRVARTALGPMVRNPAPPAIPQPTSMTRFGMTEDRRREVFRELADAEFSERRRAIEQHTWGGHAWSREDDLGYVQRARAREVAARYGLSLSQMYLVLDEGIRQRWPGPDGQPLRGTSEPINLRTE
jgi:hypothetical protein